MLKNKQRLLLKIATQSEQMERRIHSINMHNTTAHVHKSHCRETPDTESDRK